MKRLDRMKGIRKSKLNRADYLRRVLRENGVKTPEETRSAMEALLEKKDNQTGN